MATTINREQALGLLATQELNEIVKGTAKTSAALKTFRTVRMTKGQASLPVIQTLPEAGWVTEADDATGVKPTSLAKWAMKTLIPAELAVIVPIHENVLADSAYDIWGEVQPMVEESFARSLDMAVFAGTKKPAVWADPALIPGAISAGNVFTAGSDNSLDLAEDLNRTFALVEDDGFDVNTVYAAKRIKARLRGLRDKNGQPIYSTDLREDGRADGIYGERLEYVDNSAMPVAAAEAVVGDSNNAILGIRQDVTTKLLTEATVNGINLAERDMVAMRFVFRVAYAVANPAQAGVENPFPFGVLAPKAA